MIFALRERRIKKAKRRLVELHAKHAEFDRFVRSVLAEGDHPHAVIVGMMAELKGEIALTELRRCELAREDEECEAKIIRELQ